LIPGNPIRKELLSISRVGKVSIVSKFLDLHKNLPLIYITGGNQGSHVINEAVAEKLEDLLELGAVLHQTGDSKFKDFENFL
jgi:UDP-N-acetylglucosamine--N-acetylmuramyl-(pentapeptide) pyrophosphoryl-undecaprenol N-acetylglucosamine transferase